MKKTLTAALAALTFGGAAIAAAAPAEAQHYRGGYYGGHSYYGHRGNNAGTAVAAGVVGLALGAALASNSNHSYAYNRGYYDHGYYGRGYYAPAYAYDYDYAPRTCYTRQLAYDPYIGRDVVMRRAYAC